MTLRLAFTILLFWVLMDAVGQKKKFQEQAVTDTIIVEKNTLFFNRDSLYFIKNDTIIVLNDTLNTQLEELLHDRESDQETRFFEMLRARRDSSELAKKVLDILIDLEAESTKVKAQPEKMERQEEQALGKIVGEIKIKSLQVFGPSLNDTTDNATSGIARLGNKVHMHTRDRILRNRILLKKGDLIQQGELLDSERLVRTLPYVRDARLIVEQVRGDTVDLLLVSQDLLAYTGSAQPYGFDGGKAELSNINMLGYGHQLFNTVALRLDRPRKLSYRGRYRIPNIRSTQIEGGFAYHNTEFLQSYRAAFERNFLTPGIALAGGVTFEHNRTIQFAPSIDDYRDLLVFEREEDIPRHMYKRFSQDYWIARSWSHDQFYRLSPREQLTFAMRYFRKRYADRPAVAVDRLLAFHNRDLLLFSVAFSRRNYATEKLVYGYGRTEDIPIGQLTQLTFGPESGEFGNRFFTGLTLARGQYIKPLGYLSGGIRLNGFWTNNTLEDGLIEISTNNFSFPIQWKSMLFRLFLKTSYARRFSDITLEDFREGMISLNDEQGIRGMRHHLLYGREKLSFSLETVAYLPFRLFSLRFATFAFTDMGMIAHEQNKLWKAPLYQGYGLGLRIRSDRLAVETFQLRLSCYPSAPAGQSFFQVSLAGIPIASLMDFNLRKPAYYLD